MKQRHLSFGPYRIDLNDQRLWRGPEPLALSPKPVALLRYLAENAGRLVTKRELLDHVWPGVNVCDAVVKNAIGAARAALDGGAGRHAFIETEPRRGYRFVAPVEIAGVPDSVATFIGRCDAVHYGSTLVASHRLVTFTGAPGCGKTSLAAEVARRARFDGACWVDLSGAEGASIPRAMASALGLGDAAADRDADYLAHALGHRNLLLVLNDCDRSLTGVSGFVRTLLPAFPRLHLILTSRSPVGVPGEQLLAVPPLDVPPEGLTGRTAEGSDSVRLFIERARQARPDVTFSGPDLTAVASICRRLDGLPAAIEAAAHHVRAFTTSEIRDRLEELLGLSAVTPPHGHAMRSPLLGLFAGALEPLPADERECLVRLCGIPQPFTLGDAERLLRGRRERPAATAVCVLARLAGRSLVTVANSRNSHSSAYRVLEPFRTYGRARHGARRRHPTGRALRPHRAP